MGKHRWKKEWCQGGVQVHLTCLYNVSIDPSLRMLGYSGGVPTKESQFGNVPANFGMDDLSCTGRETDIRDCVHSKSHDCAEGEAAGVICS